VAPLDPRLGLVAAVTRQTLDGKNPGGWVPEEKITIEEALRAYTATNAYGVFAESTRGMLKAGYRADFVIFDTDLTTTAPDNIANARVLLTVSGGRVAWEPVAKRE
jgi:predicted amidohydrolase YtcJ